jgi:hypothetical protein
LLEHAALPLGGNSSTVIVIAGSSVTPPSLSETTS